MQNSASRSTRHEKWLVSMQYLKKTKISKFEKRDNFPKCHNPVIRMPRQSLEIWLSRNMRNNAIVPKRYNTEIGIGSVPKNNNFSDIIIIIILISILQLFGTILYVFNISKKLYFGRLSLYTDFGVMTFQKTVLFVSSFFTFFLHYNSCIEQKSVLTISA